MVFTTGAALLDAIVLCAVSQSDEGRRYYKITPSGVAQLNLYLNEWRIYCSKINKMFFGGGKK